MANTPKRKSAKRSQSYDISDPRIMSLFRPGDSAEPLVDRSSAMGLPAFFACVSLIAQSIAMLGVHVYSRTPGGGKDRVDSDPVLDLLKFEPNDRTTSFSFIEFLIQSLASTGNCYAQIIRNNAGQVMSLWQLRPEAMTVEQNTDGRILYRYNTTNGPRYLQPQDILHCIWSSDDGIVGVSPIERFAKTIGYGISLQQYSSELLNNSAIPPGILSRVDPLNDEAEAAFMRKWKEATRRRKTPILYEDMKYQSLGFPPEVMQFVASKALSVTDIAMIYHVPPVYLGVADKGMSYASMEIQQQALGTNALLPFVRRLESELNRKLCSDRTRFIEFNMDSILRPDTATRYEAHSKGLASAPFLTVNEVRAKENLPSVPDGDKILAPLNMASQQETPQDEDDVDLEPVAEDVLNRMLRKEQKAIESYRGKPDCEARTEAFYAKHAETIYSALLPVARSLRADPAQLRGICSTIDRLAGREAAIPEIARSIINRLKGETK